MEWDGITKLVMLAFTVAVSVLLPGIDCRPTRRSAGDLDRLAAWRFTRRGATRPR